MGKFNEYSQKATPADADSLMIYDAAAKPNKLSPFSGIWNWIVEKLTNAVISNLQTSNKTVIGALNELNSKIMIKDIYDTDVEKYFSTLKGNQIAFLYFGANNTNLPNIDNITWKYFSAIIIKTRAFIFSPAGYPDKIATRQFIDTSWEDWNSIK